MNFSSVVYHVMCLSKFNYIDAIRPNQIGKIFDINEKEFFRERSKSFTYANIVSH